MTLIHGVLCSTLILYVTEAGLEIKDAMYNQSTYERYEVNPMTHDAAQYACFYKSGVLAVPFMDDFEVHYRWPPILSPLQTNWYWAPMRKEGDSWRWLNGTLVDLNQNDTWTLAAQPNSPSKTCAVWRLYSDYLPVSCEERHVFSCLLTYGEGCRLRAYNRTKDPFDVDIAAYNYSIYDSLPDAVDESTAKSTPVSYKPGNDGKTKKNCRLVCDNIHFDTALPVGCWFAQYFEDLDKSERCVLLLAPSMPDVLYDIVNVTDYNISQWFRTCLYQSVYENESCPLDCSCRSSMAPSTVEESVVEEKKIKAELTLPTHNLSASVRRKTSAPDPRPSAQGMGWVGVTVAGAFLFAVVILDVTSLWRDLCLMVVNVKHFCNRENVKT